MPTAVADGQHTANSSHGEHTPYVWHVRSRAVSGALRCLGLIAGDLDEKLLPQASTISVFHVPALY